jgi:hypothetical protein
MHRLGIRGGRGYESVTAIARRGGVDRDVIVRIGRALGQSWRETGQPGRQVRYLIDEDQADAILACLREQLARWSPEHMACRRCGTSGAAPVERHHARGLCGRCYWRWKEGRGSAERTHSLTQPETRRA